MADSVTTARAELIKRLEQLTGTGEIPKLAEALTHSSYANESRQPDNQRLEFLGDAVLYLCASELLIAAHPDADEGLLTRMRSAVINAEALAKWGRKVELGSCLAVGRGARAEADAMQTNVIADAVEAVIAAVYDGCGLDGARSLVREIVGEAIGNAAALGERDSKSALQEMVQARGGSTPVYRVMSAVGPVHDQLLEVAVFVADQEVGRATARSKRNAERAAADSALAALRDAVPVAEKKSSI